MTDRHSGGSLSALIMPDVVAQRFRSEPAVAGRRCPAMAAWSAGASRIGSQPNIGTAGHVAQQAGYQFVDVFDPVSQRWHGDGVGEERQQQRLDRLGMCHANFLGCGDPSATRARLQHRRDGFQDLIGDVVDIGEDQCEVVVDGSGYQLGDETRCRREGFTPQNADIFARLDILSDGLRELRSSILSLP